VPIGIPHKSIEDDVYDGMFIPKDSTIIFNLRYEIFLKYASDGAYLNERGMSLDERVYHDPRAFVPERYFPKSKGGNSEPFFHAAFGYGRRSFYSTVIFRYAYLLFRICPGRYLGYNSVYIALAYLISVFNMEKATTSDGQPITPAFDFCDGIVQ
jgi:hypothetical protein